MANLAKSNVTIIREWTEGGTNGRYLTVVQAKFTGVSVGGSTNLALASAFGLTKILETSAVLTDDTPDQIFPAVVAKDGTHILASNPQQATDANRAQVADIPNSDIVDCYVTLRGFR